MGLFRRCASVLNLLCSMGAAEDGRAPKEELLCVRGLGLLFDGGGRGWAHSDRRAYEGSYVCALHLISGEKYFVTVGEKLRVGSEISLTIRLK